MSQREDEETRVTREVAARAIRRLDILEWVLYAGSAVLALIGGALVAWLLSTSASVAFRPVWIVSSVFLFVVPGGIALARARRDERRRTERRQQAERATEEGPGRPPDEHERGA